MATKPLEVSIVEQKVLTKEQVDAALKDLQAKGGTFEAAVGRLGFVNEEVIARFIAAQRGTQYVDLSKLAIPVELAKLVPNEVARKYRAIPVRKFREKFTFAVVDPIDSALLHLTDDMFRGRPGQADFVVSCDTMIANALDNYYPAKAPVSNMDTTMGEVGAIKAAEGVEGPSVGDLEVVPESVDSDPDQAADEAPVKRLVNSIIHDAVERRASDIHLDPVEDGLVVRFRNDGILQDMNKVPTSYRKPVIAVIKVMTKQMKIEEKRRPQDAKIKVKVGDKTIDLRVSTLPVVWGEKVVMRILDQSNLSLDLNKLFEPEELDKFDKAIRLPYGMVLVTGPTGSGKTTTLYSALSSVNVRSKNIMTAEDPVEYQLKGINQVPVNPDVGMTFALALKAFLRQDPNIIMVGEIRDFETAEIAIKAAMTGHLVFSTLHTNDAPSTITRLIDMRDPVSGQGIDPGNIATAVNLVVAQRLMRTICEKCKKPANYTTEQFHLLGLDPKDFEGAQLMKGEGCPACNKTGYKGRSGAYELMPMSPELRNMLMKHADTSDLRKQALKEGMSTLRMSAFRKAKKGQSTLEEVQRVTLE